MTNNYKRDSGFSIVELMVAMAISLLLLAGVVAIFSSTKTGYENTERQSRIQEIGRFALDQIVRDVRSAGFVGCSRQPQYASTALASPNNILYNFVDTANGTINAIQGFESTGVNTWAPAVPTAQIPSPASGSDILVLRVPARDTDHLYLTADMSSGTDTLQVSGPANAVAAGDVAAAYNCEAVAYFPVTSFNSGVITHGANLNYPFLANSGVTKMETVIYYLRASNTVGAGTSLWRRRGAANPEELVEGVERMEIRFGVDTNADSYVDEYRDANAVTNWANVMSVNVALLVRTQDEYGPDRDLRAYRMLNDIDVPVFNDRRMREVFTSNASLRNRSAVY